MKYLISQYLFFFYQEKSTWKYKIRLGPEYQKDKNKKNYWNHRHHRSLTHSLVVLVVVITKCIFTGESFSSHSFVSCLFVNLYTDMLHYTRYEKLVDYINFIFRNNNNKKWWRKTLKGTTRKLSLFRSCSRVRCDKHPIKKTKWEWGN